MTEAHLIALDPERLIAAIRAGDGEAMGIAYRRTFEGPLGRLVLAHHLYDCGVGAPLGGEDNRYGAGKHDGALDLASKAGFDAASLAVSVLTGDLEGRDEDVALGTTELVDEDLPS